MNAGFQEKTISALILCPLLMTGCATQQGNEQLMGVGLGALGGAAVGCLIGYAAAGGGGCATGAIVGGAAGAAVGWGTVKYEQYQTSQVRSDKEDQQMYGFNKAVDIAQVKIRKGSSSPAQVKAGQSVQLLTDYSVQLPARMQSVAVSESWNLVKDGKVLATLPAQQTQRTSGGWNTTASVPIPGNANPGTYMIEHSVQSGTSYDSQQSTFVVVN